MELFGKAIEAVNKHKGFDKEDLPWLLWAAISPRDGTMPKEPPFKNGKATFNTAPFNGEELYMLRKASDEVQRWAENDGMKEYSPKPAFDRNGKP